MRKTQQRSTDYSETIVSHEVFERDFFDNSYFWARLWRSCVWFKLIKMNIWKNEFKKRIHLHNYFESIEREFETCDDFERLCEPTSTNIRTTAIRFNYYSFTIWLLNGLSLAIPSTTDASAITLNYRLQIAQNTSNTSWTLLFPSTKDFILTLITNIHYRQTFWSHSAFL